MIDYKEKFTLDREFYPSRDIEITVESDRGRILSSASLRRLQKRTQVFALELNASIRSRLTHSMEVAQNARYIARTILQELKKDNLETFALEEFENAFISTSDAPSLYKSKTSSNQLSGNDVISSLGLPIFCLVSFILSLYIVLMNITYPPL